MEGAVSEGGRGPSIWDTFSATPGRTRDGHTGVVACDQYHRYEQDADLMARLGLGAYRFSIAWPRVQPEGRGRPNHAGIDHYHRVVDALNRRGIVPIPTLYHWDLPQALEDAGGWPNRDTAKRFADYAEIVHEALAGEVDRWITVNEPWVSAWLGYGVGIHAPGLADPALALAAAHHQLLGHGLAREAIASGAVGVAFNLEPHAPADDVEEDVQAARLADQQMNGWFLGPLYGRGYPSELFERFGSATDFGFVRDGDLATIGRRPPEFLGVNYYRRQTVTAARDREGVVGPVPGGLGWYVVPADAPVTAMGWPIDASGLTEILVRVHLEYAPPSMIVTENGAAFEDRPSPDGTVHDPARVDYLEQHVAAAAAAIDEGVPLHGYLVWSLLDNFEWAEGYAKRFGLVSVDFATQARTPKTSAEWYGRLVRGEADARRGRPATPG